jgi:two-component system chemotaxis sensor kinase CheA
MPDNPASAAIALLRQSIEALALEVALRDLSSPERIQALDPMLGQIRQEAAAAGLPAAAAVAVEIAGATSQQALRDGVCRLQQLAAESEAPATPVPLSEDPELIADFILESREHLSAVEGQLLALEQDPGSTEAINTIFRGFHTIKGLAGFLDFPAIERFAHEVETLLDLARNSRIDVDSTLIDIILQSADHMSRYLGGVEAGLDGKTPEPVAGVEDLLDRIRKMTAGSADEPAQVIFADLAQLATTVLSTPPAAKPSEAAPQQDAIRRDAIHQDAASLNASGGGPRAVKVDTGKLDYLVDMVGELVIAQSLIRHDPDLATVHSARLTRNINQLTRITADVQKVAMAMRMIPVRQLFQRMSRLVRDLARKSGKLANLELRGEETELDRNMVEELADPLMHMVRNAVDHGAEPPEARTAAGKSPIAKLELKAYHQGGFITIEVSDDGRGLVREKILGKARERGLVSGSGDLLSDAEVFSFIFEPGFSTATQVTDVSGRGVGMDVVRRQIMKLRGRIDIRSLPGRGSTFVIKLPLTLAIIEGLVVGVGKQRYVVPMFAVREMLRPSPEALSAVPDGGEMALVRGTLLPILRLHRRFAVTPRSEDPAAGILIIAETERKSFCLLVDELIGKQEVVIKNLGETFKDVVGIAGGCILGDGRVGLILDVEGLFGGASRE